VNGRCSRSPGGPPPESVTKTFPQIADQTSYIALSGVINASGFPICAIPTISPPELVEGLILVMSLALYWAVSAGMWDHEHRFVRRLPFAPRC
jgi:hypothetical protein